MISAHREMHMCNLYSHTSNHTAITQLILDINRILVGNMPPQTAIFPNYQAPIIRGPAGDREVAYGRWGMPSPSFALQGKAYDPGITNIRNTSSPHWRRWLGPENRCVVPWTSFSEFDHRQGSDGKKFGDTWFALSEERPLAFFAGVWTTWTSVRRLKGIDGKFANVEVTDDLYGFLTCEPNAEVGPVHEKAMPVILTTPGEVEAWLTLPWSEAKALQRPLPGGPLKVVSVGEKADPPEPKAA